MMCDAANIASLASLGGAAWAAACVSGHFYSTVVGSAN